MQHGWISLSRDGGAGDHSGSAGKGLQGVNAERSGKRRGGVGLFTAVAVHAIVWPRPTSLLTPPALRNWRTWGCDVNRWTCVSQLTAGLCFEWAQPAAGACADFPRADVSKLHDGTGRVATLPSTGNMAYDGFLSLGRMSCNWKNGRRPASGPNTTWATM